MLTEELSFESFSLYKEKCIQDKRAEKTQKMEETISKFVDKVEIWKQEDRDELERNLSGYEQRIQNLRKEESKEIERYMSSKMDDINTNEITLCDYISYNNITDPKGKYIIYHTEIDSYGDDNDVFLMRITDLNLLKKFGFNFKCYDLETNKFFELYEYKGTESC